MRELKFRAWKESENKMIEWEEFEHMPGRLIDAMNRVYLKDIMQYIGLKDMKGVEIYEGDVVKYDRVLWKVEYFHSGFAIGNDYSRVMIVDSFTFIVDGNCTDVEVIGNIYENSELIGGLGYEN